MLPFILILNIKNNKILFKNKILEISFFFILKEMFREVYYFSNFILFFQIFYSQLNKEKFFFFLLFVFYFFSFFFPLKFLVMLNTKILKMFFYIPFYYKII